MATTKSFLVYQNDKLSYEISKEGYETVTNDVIITTEEEIVEELTRLYTLTINPTPSDATVVLTASGYTQVGNSISVPYNTVVSYEVTKRGYRPVSNSETMVDDKTLNVELPEGVYVDVSGFEYTLNNKILILTKYVGAGGNVVVPNIE